MWMNESLPVDFDQYMRLTNISFWFYRIWTIGFLLIGITGNILAMLIFIRWANRLSVYIYFTCLCPINILILSFDMFYHNFLPFVINEHFMVEHILPITCKFMLFLTYFFRYIFIWLIVMINIDRCLYLTEYSLKTSLCRPRIAKMICLFIILLSFLANCHFLIFFNQTILPEENSSENKCILNGLTWSCQTWSQSYEEFFQQIWPIYNLFLFGIIPIIIMSICCILILRNIRSTRRDVVGSDQRRESDSSIISQQAHLRSVAQTLICLDLLFPLTIFPILFFYLYIHYNPPQTCLYIGIVNLILSIGYAITFLKNTFTFLIYYLSGSKFRCAFLHLIHCRNLSMYRKSP